MTNETNWPSDEQTEKAFEVVQNTGEEAFRRGQKYFRDNPVPIILLAALAGAIVGALIRPAPRKDPDPVEAVRRWFEKTVHDFGAKLPAAKKQVRGLQGDVIDQAEGLWKKLRSWCH